MLTEPVTAAVDRDPAALRRAIIYHARYSVGRDKRDLTANDYFTAVALAVRDRMVESMLATDARYQTADSKRLYYLSMEFLMGRSLRNNLENLGIYQTCCDALRDAGVELAALEEREPDAALGNGGLGRLAACFLDSLASLGMPGYGYGINYEYGLFRQEIDNGCQKELPDNWLAHGTPWEIERPQETVFVPLYGRIEHSTDRHGNYNPMWMDWKVIVGVPHDLPVVGYGGTTVNYLRLFSAVASKDFDMKIFNDGDYFKAVEQKILTETVSKVLYPSDAVITGKELRLVQEYFLVACAIRDLIRRYQRDHDSFDQFPSKVAIQLNDTHPTLAVAELMRFLIDEQSLAWEEAWDIVTATFGYTNHTLMPEALEKWPVPLLEHVLPRHMQVIYEINRRFLDAVAQRWPGDSRRMQSMSIIEESEPKQARMANLAIIGSHSVNGVAALHSELVKTSLVPDFYAFWPKKFNNKTNGVTQRRWLLACNPDLAKLLTRTVGDGWTTDLDKLRELEPYANKEGFQEEFRQIKQVNKHRLAEVIQELVRIKVDPDSLFDVQAKRIHEYKRQLLNVLHVIHEYLTFVEDGKEPIHPRTYIFAGKAAPGYWAAKQIIRLIHNVGRVVNSDARTKGKIKVVFLPDYRVSLAEIVMPAANLSEQISTAGTEASGTGNMKFAMNGALTIGTLDGANVEIKEEVGDDNIFIFGLTTEQIEDQRSRGAYHPLECYRNVPSVRRVMDALRSRLFCPEEPGLFHWIYQSLVEGRDHYFHLADLPSYLEAQDAAARTYQDKRGWDRKAILNVARIGKFSSDRTITEYARDIWGIESVR
jgi:starch phosphorylase